MQNPVLVSALDRPAFDRTQLCLFPSVSQSVSQSVFVNRSVVERLRPQFFTDFHQILQAAQECRRIDAYL